MAITSSVVRVDETDQFVISLTGADLYEIMERVRALAEAAGMTADEWRAEGRAYPGGGSAHDIAVLLGVAPLQTAKVVTA